MRLRGARPAPGETLEASVEGHAALSDDEAKLRDVVVALQANAGNVTQVATEMGKTRMQIHRWMKRFGLDPDTYRR